MKQTLSFKLNETERKEDLDAYARSRGFFHSAAMARHAFYTYLAKCHYPFKKAPVSETGSNDTQEPVGTAESFGKGQ